VFHTISIIYILKAFNIKGFYYLCVIEDNDLKTRLSHYFGYMFFPVTNIENTFKGSNLQDIKISKIPDFEDISLCSIFADKDIMRFRVTKTNSILPLNFQKDNNGIDVTLGGLSFIRRDILGVDDFKI
jgi:glutaredoxin-related protein